MAEARLKAQEKKKQQAQAAKNNIPDASDAVAPQQPPVPLPKDGNTQQANI